MTIVFVGTDIAKRVFAVRGMDERCKPALVRPKVTRAKLGYLEACSMEGSVGGLPMAVRSMAGSVAH